MPALCAEGGSLTRTLDQQGESKSRLVPASFMKDMRSIPPSRYLLQSLDEHIGSHPVPDLALANLPADQGKMDVQACCVLRELSRLQPLHGAQIDVSKLAI